MEVHYYLKPPRRSGRRLIYLQFKFGAAKPLRWSFGISTHDANWDNRKERMKSNNATIGDGSLCLNDLLDDLAKQCLKYYYEELAKGKPTADILRQRLNDYYSRRLNGDNQSKGFYDLFQRFCSGEIKNGLREKSKDTLKTYRTAYNHLTDFEKETGFKINYESLNLTFYDKYTHWLSNRGLSISAAGKDIQILKTVLKTAFLRHETICQHYIHFKVLREKTHAAFLSDGEIQSIWMLDLSNNRALEATRDMFVFACRTGLRWSDFSRITKENIVERNGKYYIVITTKKTGKLIAAPCMCEIPQIFAKYSDRPNWLPKIGCQQKFNIMIKEVCKLACLRQKGRDAGNPSKELWECVKTHTARRSFITNMKKRGVPNSDIMSMTGHDSEKNLQLYNKESALEAAERIGASMEVQTEPKTLLSVV